MKTIRSRWVMTTQSGKLLVQISEVEAGPDSTMKYLFDEVSKINRRRSAIFGTINVLVLSPETIPNPDAFKHPGAC